MQTDSGAVLQVQLRNDAAALHHVQLLPYDLLIAMHSVLLPEPGHEEAFPVVKNAEAQVVHRQKNAHGKHDQAAHDQHRPVADANAERHDAQHRQHHAEHAEALVRPDGHAGTVLRLAPERPGKALIHQIAHTEHGGCDQQNNDKLHIFLSLYICVYAQSTVSTGMSCSSVSRWGST